MLDDETVGPDATADQMFLDDPLEDRRITRGIPRAFGIDDGDRATFADAETVRFRAQNAALLRQTELFQPALEKFPRREPAIFLAALRGGLVATQEDVAFRDGNPNCAGNGALRIRHFYFVVGPHRHDLSRLVRFPTLAGTSPPARLARAFALARAAGALGSPRLIAATFRSVNAVNVQTP